MREGALFSHSTPQPLKSAMEIRDRAGRRRPQVASPGEGDVLAGREAKHLARIEVLLRLARAAVGRSDAESGIVRAHAQLAALGVRRVVAQLGEGAHALRAVFQFISPLAIFASSASRTFSTSSRVNVATASGPTSGSTWSRSRERSSRIEFTRPSRDASQRVEYSLMVSDAPSVHAPETTSPATSRAAAAAAPEFSRPMRASSGTQRSRAHASAACPLREGLDTGPARRRASAALR